MYRTYDRVLGIIQHAHLMHDVALSSFYPPSSHLQPTIAQLYDQTVYTRRPPSKNGGILTAARVTRTVIAETWNLR